MPSPIERLIDQACMRCTICDQPAGTCACWVRCVDCGHSFQRGQKCRCWAIEEPVAALVDGLIADIDADFSTRKMVRRDMIERVVRRHAREYFRTCFEVNAAAKRKT